MSDLKFSAAARIVLLALAAGAALNSSREANAPAATMEVVSSQWQGAPDASGTVPQISGTAFAIGPNQFATTAHTIQQFIGSRYPRLLVMDSQGVEHEISRVLSYSETQDFAVIELAPPADPTPIQKSTRQLSLNEAVTFIGRKGKEGIKPGTGAFRETLVAPSRDDTRWITFTGDVWHGLSGGPLLDSSSNVVGMVSQRRENEPHLAVPIDAILGANTQVARFDVAALFEPLGLRTPAGTTLGSNKPLAEPWSRFQATANRFRNDQYEKHIGTLLKLAREQYTITGPGAAQNCEVLNGEACICPKAEKRGPEKFSFDAPDSEVLRSMRDGGEFTHVIWGAVIVRSSRASTGRTASVAAKADLHQSLAFKGRAESDSTDMRERARDGAHLRAEAETTRPREERYRDSSGRTWTQRVWALKGHDYMVVSLARDLRDGHVVLMRAVPTAYERGSVLQLRVVANLAYACGSENL